MKNGVIIINKGEGLTSQAVVNRVKRLLGADKAGHTGTLDPMATGVLPVLVNRGVKASEFMLTSDKHYAATLLLGVTTDTEDVTGEVLTTSASIPDEEKVREVVAEFVGEYMQTPPMYSALKVGGKKLYELAREGQVIEREARAVRIHSISVKRLSDTEYSLDVECSKGTYIRTLCADIGARLGCGGTMKTLERCEASGFLLSDSITLAELEGMAAEERWERVLPIEHIFREKKEVILEPFFARLARAGQEIYLKKIRMSIPEGELVRLTDSEGFFALGEVRSFEAGLAIKPIRQF
ncbi:MAG: tRNA pseudouridine(55) synthase TruB [Clostridia bacterium]|nr:tRNA pseudouridine(55) synthase TruB [Clostridia bacterium]